MTPSILVLHYTDTKDVDEALRLLTDPTTEVSAHYVVDEAGVVYPLVAEEGFAKACETGFALDWAMHGWTQRIDLIHAINAKTSGNPSSSSE